MDLSHCHLAPGVFGHFGFAMPQGKTVEIIALILARPRPPLPPGTDAVEVVKRAAGATSSALSFKCKCVLLVPRVHTPQEVLYRGFCIANRQRWRAA